jgi:hypothetical protein
VGRSGNPLLNAIFRFSRNDPNRSRSAEPFRWNWQKPIQSFNNVALDYGTLILRQVACREGGSDDRADLLAQEIEHLPGSALDFSLARR